MPGGRSLAAGQYYAHRQNRFWRIMSRVLGRDFDVDYARRTGLLLQAGVGLWDVLECCERPDSSLDARIVRGSEVPNDFRTCLDDHPSIRAFALNGTKAAQLFERLAPVPVASRVDMLRLPSTSPANTRISLDQQVEQWRRLAPFLE